jgi:branched-chain amino acid aminotransferase
MSIKADWIWMDGSLVPFADAKVHVLSQTLHYGIGAFEGIRAYQQPDGRAGVWRLGEHIERLLQTLLVLRQRPLWSAEEIERACFETLAANHQTDAYLRPIAYLGHGAMGLGARSNALHLAIGTWPWASYLGDEVVAKGIRLGTSSFTRNHPNSAMQRAKVSGHYVNSVLARYQANDDGYDEGIMLDQNGFVAEGTGENLFVVHKGRVLTPPVLNVLPGITRASVIEILQHEGIEVVETLFGRDTLYMADEVFLCGTAAEITPARELDHRQIGKGGVGPVTQRVKQLYGDAVRGRVPWMAHHIALPG